MEIWKHWFPEIDYGDADVVAFLGDIGNGLQPLEMMKEVMEAKEGRKVIYIIGNHEYYGHELNDMNQKIRDKAKEYGIIILDDATHEIDGITFIGATLWTDYEVDPTMPTTAAMAVAARGINDHRVIRNAKTGTMFSTRDALTLNEYAKQFVFDEIEKAGRENCVVLSHHSPTKQGIAPQFEGSPLNGAFNNDWDDLIKEKGPRIWAYGHTHWDIDLMIGDTRVVSRQLGYPGERVQTKQGEFEPLEIVL